MSITLSLKNDIYNQRTLLLGVFLFSLITSLIFLGFFKDVGPVEHQVPNPDYVDRYKPIAESILEGKGVPIFDNEDITGTPGYPLLLVPILSLSRLFEIYEVALIIVFNTVVAALAACFFFLITKSFFTTPVALTASFLWNTYPLQLWFLKNPNTEVPFMLLFFVAIWLYRGALRRPRASMLFLIGVVLGYAILIRPVALLLPLVFSFIIWLKIKKETGTKAIYLGLMIFLGSGVLLAPWILYVYAKTGNFIPVSTIGPTVAVVGLSYALVPDGRHQFEVPPDVSQLMADIQSASLQTGGEIFSFVLQKFVTEPLPLITLLGLKLVRSWYATYLMWWETHILLLQLPYLILGLVGIGIAFKTYKDKKLILLFLITLILYFWSMTFLGLSIVRYMLPAMAIVILFATVSVSQLMAAFPPSRIYRRLWKRFTFTI